MHQILSNCGARPGIGLQLAPGQGLEGEGPETPKPGDGETGSQVQIKGENEAKTESVDGLEKDAKMLEKDAKMLEKDAKMLENDAKMLEKDAKMETEDNDDLQVKEDDKICVNAVVRK